MSDPSNASHNPSQTESPLGLAKEVESLISMPQSLCKQRGMCCKVATFKGSLSYEELQEAASNPEHPDHEMAQDFISVFMPYPSQEAVREVADEFVDRVRTAVSAKGQNPDNITFFECKYLLSNGRCGVHEDRPTGCRTYPFPHKNTIYHPGCGFEQQGAKNWNRIEEILTSLGVDPDNLWSD